MTGPKPADFNTWAALHPGLVSLANVLDTGGPLAAGARYAFNMEDELHVLGRICTAGAENVLLRVVDRACGFRIGFTDNEMNNRWLVPITPESATAAAIRGFMARFQDLGLPAPIAEFRQGGKRYLGEEHDLRLPTMTNLDPSAIQALHYFAVQGAGGVPRQAPPAVPACGELDGCPVYDVRPPLHVSMKALDSAGISREDTQDLAVRIEPIGGAPSYIVVVGTIDGDIARTWSVSTEQRLEFSMFDGKATPFRPVPDELLERPSSPRRLN